MHFCDLYFFNWIFSACCSLLVNHSPLQWLFLCWQKAVFPDLMAIVFVLTESGVSWPDGHCFCVDRKRCFLTWWPLFLCWQKGVFPDLMATSGDYLRVWRVGDSETRLECLLNNVSWVHLISPNRNINPSDIPVGCVYIKTNKVLLHLFGAETMFLFDVCDHDLAIMTDCVCVHACMHVCMCVF